MEWVLSNSFDTGDGEIRWNRWGTDGDPIVLVHGTPYSSFLWRDIAPALAQSHRVYVFDLLGYGQSDKQEGQDLTLAAQARHFAHLLASWQIPPPRVVANDIGGAISLRALLLEDASYADMTLFDCCQCRTGNGCETGSRTSRWIGSSPPATSCKRTHQLS